MSEKPRYTVYYLHDGIRLRTPWNKGIADLVHSGIWVNNEGVASMKLDECKTWIPPGQILWAEIND